MDDTFFDGHDELYHHAKFGGRSYNVRRLQVRKHGVCMFISGRMPRSGKLPVLNLLTGQKSGFSLRRGHSLHQFTSNLAQPTGI